MGSTWTGSTQPKNTKRTSPSYSRYTHVYTQEMFQMDLFFKLYVQELRHVFHDDALRSNTAEKLIACALGAGLQYIEDSYDIPAIAK